MSLARRDFRFLEPLRVRWAEVDLQKIVFNGHYLMYVDTAIAGYWRALALPYHDTMEALEGDLYVRKATLEYEGSARYDDALVVGVRTQRIGTSSMVMQTAVFRREQLLVHGELVYVFADPKSQTSRPVPQPLRDLMLRYEAGEAMVSARIGDWVTVADEVQQARRSLPEAEAKGLSASMTTQDDAAATHVVLLNRLAHPVAATRLTAPSADERQLDAAVIHPALRQGPLLAPLLQAARSAARGEGAQRLVIEAPTGWAPTLERHGFTAVDHVSPRDSATRRLTCAV